MDKQVQLIEQALDARGNRIAAEIYLALKKRGLNVTQQEFANILGVTRSRFNQVVKSLRCKKT